MSGPHIARLAARAALVAIAMSSLGQARLLAQAGPEPSRALLRMASDSATVGHYKFTLTERRQLSFDIPSDDPRSQLLASASEPKLTQLALVATVVSSPVPDNEERRYTAYWLGFSRGGTEGGGLSPAQWDSIFRKVGRRAVLRFTPEGQPRGVEVGSDAVRPVGQALGDILSGLALHLPPDSVAAGDRWEGPVGVPVRTPDGERRLALIRVTYRLRALSQEADGVVAHIEFDGEAAPGGDEEGVAGLGGRYFGESRFSIGRGRYDHVMAIANLALEWDDPGGLPPARLSVEWQAVMDRS